AHMNLGEFAAAESTGHALERHVERFAPLDRSYLAWVLATCRGDGPEALRAARAMANLAPGSEALYLLAEDAMALNRPHEAVDARLAEARDGLAARPPAEAASAAHQLRVALVAYTAGRLADAQRGFEGLAADRSPGRSDSLAAVAVMGDGWDQMDYLGYRGAIAARQGKRDEALRADQLLARVQ